MQGLVKQLSTVAAGEIYIKASLEHQTISSMDAFTHVTRVLQVRLPVSRSECHGSQECPGGAQLAPASVCHLQRRKLPLRGRQLLAG